MLTALSYFRSGSAELAGVPVTAVRLSYVGEAGWEITCKATDAEQVCGALASFGAQPAGLFAQTAMRIEKRFLAYGHDLDTDISPLQAGLGFAIDWDSDFIGREALKRQREAGEACRIVTVLLDDPEAGLHGGEPVVFDGEVVGMTTSAAFGYRIGRHLAIADLRRPEAREEGASVGVDIAGQRWPARVTLRAAFDPEGQAMRTLPARAA